MPHLALPDGAAHHLARGRPVFVVDFAHAPQAKADKGNRKEMIGQRRIQLRPDAGKARCVEDHKADDAAYQAGRHHVLLKKADSGAKKNAQQQEN